MEKANYTFQISAYDTEKLLPQVSKALEKRTELVSREQYPGLWNHTDRFNAMAQGRTQRRQRIRLMCIVCLVLGVFQFVPGLVEPQELTVPLIVGAIAIGAGIIGLWCNREHKRNPFDKSAKLLLAGKDSISTEPVPTVSFSEEGMTIPTEDGNTEFVAYDGFECAIETADIILFVYDTRVTVLQKNDLKIGSINEFCGLLAEKIAKFVRVE